MPRLCTVLFLLPLVGCYAGPPTRTPTPESTAAPAAGAAQAPSAADAKKLEKELRAKQRELDVAMMELEISALSRRERETTVEAGLVRSADDRARAAAELEDFQKNVRPRELEQKRLELDQSVYRAEHQKDELGELTAMYENDEFASATKELVLKRGRRELEVAERRLALAQKELRHLEEVELPKREQDLQRKLADAELEQQKSQTGAQKARLELELAAVKAKQRIEALAEEIAELQTKLATAKEAK